MMGALVRAAEACYDGALAYRTPFVSGKDSLNNQFTTEDGAVIAIPPTMLITAVGIVNDVTRCRHHGRQAAGHRLMIVGETTAAMGGSHLAMLTGRRGVRIPRSTRAPAPRRHARRHGHRRGPRPAAHDCSDGGLLVAAAEMAFAGRVGLDLDLAALPAGLDLVARCFAETPSRYLLEVTDEDLDAVTQRFADADVPVAKVGRFADHDRLTLAEADLDAPLDELRRAWRGALDW